MTFKPLRVAVFSPHPLTRAGLSALLADQPEHIQVYNVSTPEGHLNGHDVAVYDLAGVIASNGSDLQRLVASGKPVLGLLPLDRQDLAKDALVAGVVAVLYTDITRTSLLKSVQHAAAQEQIESKQPTVWHRKDPECVMTDHGLTERELTILKLIGTGIRNQEIAAELYLSINSVKSYIRTAYHKIGAKSRSQAVLWAAQHPQALGQRASQGIETRSAARQPGRHPQRHPGAAPPRS